MILADTSVWIDHFRLGNKRLHSLLDTGDIVCHPFVVGELACGNLVNREEMPRSMSRTHTSPSGEMAVHQRIRVPSGETRGAK